MSRIKLNLLGLAFCVAATGSALPAAVLRVVSYDIASSGGAPRSGLDTILQGIGSEVVAGNAEPIDILGLQEVSSQFTTSQAVVGLLNGIYGAGTYSRGFLEGGSTGSGTQGVVYNSQKLQLLSETAIGTSGVGQPRQTLRYKFHVIGTPAASDFYVYNGNWSTDETRRPVEAQAIRADADALGAGASIIYLGNFNLAGSSEAAWTAITAPGAGMAHDPLNRLGSWHNSSVFVDIMTQAPANAPPGGLTGGGLDDRFDFQLLSSGLLAAGGLEYFPGTYHTFGNNGSVALNGNINDASNTALAGLANRTQLLNLLVSVTDHLPVVADYVVAVPEPASLAMLMLPAAFLLRRSRQLFP